MRCATRKGGVPDEECRVGKGSDDGDGGVRNKIEGANPGQRAPFQRSSPSMLSIAKRKIGRESGMKLRRS